MSIAKFKSLLRPDESVTEQQLATDQKILKLEQQIDRLSRRRFMGGLTGATALVATAGFIDLPKAMAQSAAPAIPDVLNFALNLEYLEANFYYFAAYGSTIPASYQGSAPGAITGTSSALTTAVQSSAVTLALAKALAQDELNHISDLRSAITSLGGTPISQPAIYYAANGSVTTVPQFLASARQFTALGNSAYAGAAQYLVSNTAILTAASQILGAEGQHLGAVNYQCITQGVTIALQGSATAAIDIQDTPPSPTQYFTVFNTSYNPSKSALLGFSPARTTSQDLGVVYGKSTATTLNPPTGSTSGGFFPNGVNGNIKST